MTVNLIPEKNKKIKKVGQVLDQVYVVLLSLIAILLITSFFFSVANKYLAGAIANADNKVAETQSRVNQYKDLETNIRQANIKLDILKKINTDRIVWSEVVTELSDKTPQNVQIQSLTLNKSTGNVSLSGIAESRKNIADMKDELENSTIFRNVIFSTSSYNDHDFDYSFTLSADLEGTKNAN